VGKDPNAVFVTRDLTARGVNAVLIPDETRPTTFKIRYMVENQKLFRVSRLKEHKLARDIEDAVVEQLQELAPKVDGILISDFVYGVVTPRVLEVVSELASKHELKLFGDLQCSSQVGNVSKFVDFDLVCPTEREARIALNNQDDGIEWIANNLIEITRAKNMIVKLGDSGFIAYGSDPGRRGLERQHFPAFVANPVDVTGAGDSLIAVMAVALCSGCGLMEASALGAVMAALAVQTVGNTPIPKERLRKYIDGLEVG
jgi:rfaE bifunctional protein kinase chain/domain